jgi:hypothetical protein
MGRVVIYNHPGSADGKYPPIQSPAIIQKVEMGEIESTGDKCLVCDLFVMSNTGGIFFAKGILEGEGPSQWQWPKKVSCLEDLEL